MYCSNCGSQNDHQADTCSNCGQRLNGAEIVQPVATSYEIEYAGFWRRFLAAVLDGIITGVVTSIIGFVLGLSEGTVNFISFIGGWLYYALMESSSYQGTLGKMIIGIAVTDLAGDRISFGRATGRYFAKIISAILLFIGFIMAAFTEKKQALHDMIAGTLVVMKRRGL